MTRNKILRQKQREVLDLMTSSSQINNIYTDHLFFWEFTGGDKSRNNEWNPPPLYMKVNFDASVREEKTCVATVGRYCMQEGSYFSD